MKLNIDVDAINKRLKEYEKSSEGKKRKKEFLENCIENDIRKTEAGSVIVTEEMMEEAARLMIQTLKNVAFATEELPESVRAHFASLDNSPPTKVSTPLGDRYIVNIYFTDDLSRFSLVIAKGRRRGQFTGEGIDNIVSLFDTGFAAKSTAHGLWYGHEDIGPIKSKQSRAGLYFMRDAVRLFNDKFSKKYGVEAYIAADSKYYARDDSDMVIDDSEAEE